MGGARPLSPAGVLSSRRVGGVLKVLIADDDRLVRTMVADLLEDLGHAVVAAANGAEAVDLGAREAPDVLILDFLMPKLSGLDALKALRARGVSAPAVLLTAITDGSFRAMDGAEAIRVRLEKPVTRRSLERALARATRR